MTPVRALNETRSATNASSMIHTDTVSDNGNRASAVQISPTRRRTSPSAVGFQGLGAVYKSVDSLAL